MPVVTRSCGSKLPRRRIEDPTPARTCRSTRATAKRKDLSDEENERPPKKKVNINSKQQKSTKSFCEKKKVDEGLRKSKIPRRCVTEKHPLKNMISSDEDDNEDNEIQFKTSDFKKAKSPEINHCIAQDTPTAVSARTRSYSALRRSYRLKKQNQEADKKNVVESSRISTSGNSDVFENVEGNSVEEKLSENSSPSQVKDIDSSTCDYETEIKQVDENQQIVSSSEEDKNKEYYRRKFHEMVQKLNQMQEQFSEAHQNTLKSITAYDAFVKELKSSLEQEKRKNATTEEELCQTREQLLIAQKEIEFVKTKEQNEENYRSTNTTCTSQEPSRSEERNHLEDELEKADFTSLHAMVKFYAQITGITLSNDSPVSKDELIESYRCIYRPKGPTGQVMHFRLTHDKEFEEYEYSPNFQSPEKGEFFQKIPGYLKEDMYFNSDQAQSFLASLIKTIQKV